MITKSFPALILHKKFERVLIVADLHLGWEAALSEKGIHLPSQMPKILERLIQLIKENKPTTIIFLGDVKHTPTHINLGEWNDIPDFFESICKIVEDIRVIPGNHDGNLIQLLPRNVKLLPSRGVVLWSDVGLFHGHTWPDQELLACQSLVMGHIHPMLSFRDSLGFRVARQVWVNATCNTSELARSIPTKLKESNHQYLNMALTRGNKVNPRFSQLIIMPSFNDFLGGQPINIKENKKSMQSTNLISPILRSRSINLNDAELYLLDGTFLSTIRQARTLY